MQRMAAHSLYREIQVSRLTVHLKKKKKSSEIFTVAAELIVQTPSEVGVQVRPCCHYCLFCGLG